MAKKLKEQNPFVGRWRIVSMEQWDQDYVDEEEEGFFEFTVSGGSFHFGYVQGHMDSRKYRNVHGRRGREGRRFVTAQVHNAVIL